MTVRSELSMKKRAMLAILACLIGCRAQTAATRSHHADLGSSASSVEDQRFRLLTQGVLTEEQFADEIVGTWASVWSRPSGPRVEELDVRPDGAARAVVIDGESREGYEGPYVFSLARPYDPHSITFARLVIQPDVGPGITLSRINFGQHNAVLHHSGPFLRIDGDPKGNLTGVMKRVEPSAP
jgi:hypothetical protein